MSTVEKNAKIGISADTSLLTRALRAAEDGFKSFASASSTAMSHVSGAIAGAQAAFGKFSVAWGTLQKGLDLGRVAGEMRALERAVPVGTINKLSDATRGTVNNVELLRVAARAMNGDFALTQQQMSLVMETAMALSNRGYGPVTQVAEKLSEALAKGVNKLDDFGINLEKSGDRTTDLAHAFSKFHEIIDNTGPVDAQTEAIKRQQAAIENLTDAVKHRLGNAVNDVLGAVESASSDAGLYIGVALETDTAEERDRAIAEIRQSDSWGAKATHADIKRRIAARKAQEEKARADEIRKIGNQQTGWGALADYYKQAQEMVDKGYVRVNGQWVKKPTASTGGGGSGPDVYQPDPFKANYYETALARAGGWGSDMTSAANAGWQQQTGGAIGTGGLGGGGQGGIASWMQSLQGPTKQIFGGTAGETWGGMDGGKQQERLDEFGKKLQDRTQMLGGAFGALTDGITAAVDAAISGSESVGKAFLKASAAALKALAIESTVRALFNTAMGLGALVIDPPAAAGYFAAAGKFAATAAAAGLGSAALGAAAGGGGHATGPSSYGDPHGRIRDHRSGGEGGSVTVINNISGVLPADKAHLGSVIADATRQAMKTGRASSGTTTVKYE